MRFSNLVVAVFAASVSQGNIAAALPTEARFSQSENLYGRSAPDSLEDRDANETTLETRDESLEARAPVTNIFPPFPISSNDLLWAGVLTGCSVVVIKGTRKVWSKVPQEWKDSAAQCIANRYNAAFHAHVTAEEVEREGHELGEHIQRGAEAIHSAVP